METMSWQQQLSGADVYLKRVKKNSNSYSPDLLYNLCAMAIEQYFMALCVYKNVLPENHRFSDLVDAVSSFTPVDGNIIEDLKKMEAMQEICSLEGYSRKKSTIEDVPFYITTTEVIRAFVIYHIPEASAVNS
ncbi:MAG: hypothetical protein GXY77_11680 [Fibrobacter sp.]|nr:hypothetical protein [Fibrobacter sp.]